MGKRENERKVEKTCRHVKGVKKFHSFGEAKQKKCKELASLV